MIPVTAGKNTANTGQNPSDEGPGTLNPCTSASGMGAPKRSETSDSPMAAMMKYWARIATRADVSASTVTRTVVTIPTTFSFRTGNTLTTLSANPTVYSATESACAR